MKYMKSMKLKLGSSFPTSLSASLQARSMMSHQTASLTPPVWPGAGSSRAAQSCQGHVTREHREKSQWCDSRGVAQ